MRRNQLSRVFVTGLCPKTRAFATSTPSSVVQPSFPFLSNNTFLKVKPASAENPTPFSIAGIPYDGACTNRTGSRFGPRAIREASHMACDATHPHFHVSPLNDLSDHGDLVFPHTNLTEMRKQLEITAYELLKQCSHVVWLGGDHSVTLSLLRAHFKLHGRPLAVLHFDAHCDTWEDHFSEPSGHGTWVYEAIQEGLVIPQCFTQMGIRSSGERKTLEYVSEQGGQIFTGRDLRGLENASQLKEVLGSIMQRHEDYGRPPTYLTLDIDCLDPAFAPGTGTPEIGGMTTGQVMTILEVLCPKLNFVGMDCVEVAPPYDHAEITSNAAAGFVWTYLCARMVAAAETASIDGGNVTKDPKKD